MPKKKLQKSEAKDEKKWVKMIQLIEKVRTFAAF